MSDYYIKKKHLELSVNSGEMSVCYSDGVRYEVIDLTESQTDIIYEMLGRSIKYRRYNQSRERPKYKAAHPTVRTK